MPRQDHSPESIRLHEQRKRKLEGFCEFAIKEDLNKKFDARSWSVLTLTVTIKDGLIDGIEILDKNTFK